MGREGCMASAEQAGHRRRRRSRYGTTAASYCMPCGHGWGTGAQLICRRRSIAGQIRERRRSDWLRSNTAGARGARSSARLVEASIVAANQPRPGAAAANGRSDGSEAKKNHVAWGSAGHRMVGSPNGAFQKPNPAVPLSVSRP